MEVWLGGGNGPEEVDGRVSDGMMAMDVEELAARAVKWKGISSASMVDPQEHKKGSGAQTKGLGVFTGEEKIWICN